VSDSNHEPSNHEPLETSPSSYHNDTAIQTVLEIFPNVNPDRALQLHQEGKSARTMVSIIAEESCQSTRRMEMIERELEDEDDVSLGEEILPSGQDYGDVFLYGQYCEDKRVVQDEPSARKELDKSQIGSQMKTILEFLPFANLKRAERLLMEHSLSSVLEILGDDLSNDGMEDLGDDEEELEANHHHDDDVSFGEEGLSSGQCQKFEEVGQHEPLAAEELSESQSSLRLKTILDIFPFADAFVAQQLLLEHSLSSVLDILGEEMSYDGQNEVDH
jgi:hypothetical protein